MLQMVVSVLCSLHLLREDLLDVPEPVASPVLHPLPCSAWTDSDLQGLRLSCFRMCLTAKPGPCVVCLPALKHLHSWRGFPLTEDVRLILIETMAMPTLSSYNLCALRSLQVAASWTRVLRDSVTIQVTASWVLCLQRAGCSNLHPGHHKVGREGRLSLCRCSLISPH